LKYLHRFNFLFIMVVAIVWGCFAFQVNPIHMLFSSDLLALLLIFYMLLFTAVFWPLAYVELFDLFYSASGRNGKEHSKYFLTLKRDLYGSSITALALGYVYWSGSVDYDFSGVDIGFVGVPFIVLSVLNLLEIMKFSFAGVPVRKFPFIVLLIIVFIFSYISVSYFQRSLSGNYEEYQAIWFQVTIVFASFCFYNFTSWQSYFLRSNRVEISKFKSYFLREVSPLKSINVDEVEKSIERVNNTRKVSRAKFSSKKRKSK
jgi:hypothetical protein